MVPVKISAGLAACGETLFEPLVEWKEPIQQLAVLRHLPREQLTLFIFRQAPVQKGLPFLLHIVDRLAHKVCMA